MTNKRRIGHPGTPDRSPFHCSAHLSNRRPFIFLCHRWRNHGHGYQQTEVLKELLPTVFPPHQVGLSKGHCCLIVVVLTSIDAKRAPGSAPSLENAGRTGEVPQVVHTMGISSLVIQPFPETLSPSLVGHFFFRATDSRLRQLCKIFQRTLTLVSASKEEETGGWSETKRSRRVSSPLVISEVNDSKMSSPLAHLRW